MKANELKEPFTPGAKDKQGIVRHIRYEIESFFFEPKCNESSANLDLQESILFRRMGHCRVLAEFFTKSERQKQRGYPDDTVLAGDFGFNSTTRAELFGEEFTERFTNALTSAYFI